MLKPQINHSYLMAAANFRVIGAFCWLVVVKRRAQGSV